MLALLERQEQGMLPAKCMQGFSARKETCVGASFIKFGDKWGGKQKKNAAAWLIPKASTNTGRRVVGFA